MAGERRAWRSVARGLALVAAAASSGCGEAVSLDVEPVEPTGSTGTSDSGSSPGAASTTEGGDQTTDVHPPVPDVPDEPPEVCEPGCERELRRIWSWDEALPQERETSTFSAMTVMSDGTVFLAEQDGYQPLVRRIAFDGEYLGAEPLSLFCNCEIIDMAQSFIGDIIFTAEGGLFQPELIVGRINPFGPSSTMYSYLFPLGTEERWPRMGAAVPMSTDGWGPGTACALSIQPEFAFFPEPPLQERIKLNLFDLWGQSDFQGGVLDTQRETDSGARPVGVEVAGGDLAVAFPAFTGEREEGYVVWVDPYAVVPRDAQRLPGIPDAVAVGPMGKALVLSHVQLDPGRLELHLGLFAPEVPPTWEILWVIETNTVGQARLSVDSMGRPHVAVHLDRDGEPERAVELLAFDVDGSLRWRETVPLDAQPDLEMEVTNGGGVVLAGTVDGRTHAELRHTVCECDD